VTQIEFIVAEK